MKKITNNTETRIITKPNTTCRMVKRNVFALVADLDSRGEFDGQEAHKRAAFRSYLASGKTIEAPLLGKDENGNLTIINGRHRMLELLAADYETIWVAIRG